MEVAVGDELALLDEDEWVVGGRVQLDSDRRLGIREQVAAGAVDLRRAAERVGVLHLVAPPMRLQDRGALEQPDDVGGRRLLPGERSQGVDLGEKARARALERLEREGARNVCGARQPLSPHQHERPDSCHELRAVDEGQAFLRAQPNGLETDPVQGLRARKGLALDNRLALPDEREREVRERREVAGRSDRPATRDDRRDAAVEAFEQEVDRLRPRARVALGEGVRTQQHRGTHDLRRIGASHAARVAPEEAKLELLGELGRDRLGDEAAEPGVDSVRVLPRALGSPALDQLTRGLQTLPPLVGELGPSALDRDGPDVL